MVVDMVAVLFGMYPAIILVAPYSPKALEKASISPAIISFFEFGNISLQNIQVFDLPKVWPAKIIFSSKLSKAARLVLYISGKDTRTQANIAEYQRIIRLTLSVSKNCPIREFVPKIFNKKKPITVGGKTRGRVKITSTTPFAQPGSFLIW